MSGETPGRRPRGQALVLFALFVLVLVLASMATMSLSHLTHQKMELQVASDTAAYSQAVAAARAFNSVALLNRAQVSTMVALAGVDSAVSYAAAYRAALNATWYSYAYELDVEYCQGNPPGNNVSFPPKLCDGLIYQSHPDCRYASHGLDAHDRNNCYGDSGNGYGSTQATNDNACQVWLEIYGWGAIPPAVSAPFNNNARMPLMRVEFDRIKEFWQGLDDAAGLQARNVQSEAAAYDDLQASALADAAAVLQPFAQRSISVVGGTVNGGSTAVAAREYSSAYGGGEIVNSLEAAMGSRAHEFITLRTDGARAIEDQIERVLNPSGASLAEVTIAPLIGNGYFATPKNHGARPASTFSAWGDDHSISSANYLGPGAANATPQANPGASSRPLRFEAWVQSTDRQNTGDLHDWCPEDFEPEAVPPDERHTLHPHSAPPAGQFDPCAASSCIWPAFHDANAGLITNPGDVYGQPKLFATATKDLAGQSDPWNLFFRFRFAQTGAGAQVDTTAQHAVAGVVPELQSLAASLAYYHRPGHWQEPPNMFNPYWRATLVRANVDNTWLGDIRSSIGPGNRDALNRLVGVGYQGIP